MKTIRALLIALVIFLSVHRQTVCMGKFLHFAKCNFSACKLKNLAFYLKLLDQSKKNTVINFLGPPASGKGTVSKLCVDLLGCKHISTGDLCREHIDQPMSIINLVNGNLIDDNLVFAMVEESLEKAFANNTLAILDGLPRTPNQATKLVSLLHEKFKNVQTKVVQFVVNDDFVIEYSTNRLICPDCKAIFVETNHSPSIPKISGTCDFCFEDLKRREDEFTQKKLR